MELLMILRAAMMLTCVDAMTSLDCGILNHTNISGSFSAPKLPINDMCNWTISLPENERIGIQLNISLMAYKFKGGFGCGSGKVKFYDTSGTAYPDTYCGIGMRYIEGRSNTIQVNYIQGVPLTPWGGSAFSLAWAALSCEFMGHECSDDYCDGVRRTDLPCTTGTCCNKRCGTAAHTGMSGSFSSPVVQGRSRYPENINCHWTITLPDDEFAVMIRLDMNLDPICVIGDQCVCDYVKFYDNHTGSHLGTHCGKGTVYMQNSTSNVVLVTFRTDGGYYAGRTSFSLTWADSDCELMPGHECSSSDCPGVTRHELACRPGRGKCCDKDGYGSSHHSNIAYGKTTRQRSTSYTSKTERSAKFAVDGNTNETKCCANTRDGEFADTYNTRDQWWRVDLGKTHLVYKVMLWNRLHQAEQPSHISILSSVVDEPSDPTLSSSDWILRAYRREQYGAIGSETFKPEPTRHLAVFNSLRGGVTLVEFMAFARNQSGDCDGNNACGEDATCTESTDSTCLCGNGWNNGNTEVCSDKCTMTDKCHSGGTCTRTDGNFSCSCDITGFWNCTGCGTLHQSGRHGSFRSPIFPNDTEHKCNYTIDPPMGEGVWLSLNLDVNSGDDDTCSEFYDALHNTPLFTYCGQNRLKYRYIEVTTAVRVEFRTTEGRSNFTLEWWSDVDECTNDTDNCSPHAVCNNTAGSFSCACNEGYLGNGTDCEDICTDNCSADAVCTKTKGSFSCTCNEGFSGNGTDCKDVDECINRPDNCSPDAVCTNTKGSFSCVCNEGFSGNGADCEDVDECTVKTDSCSPNAVCTNNEGTFSCACNEGFSGNGTDCEENSSTVGIVFGIIIGLLVALAGVYLILKAYNNKKVKVGLDKDDKDEKRKTQQQD